MKRLSRFRRTVLLLCVLLLTIPSSAFAEDATNYKDTQTNLQIRMGGDISGPHMVYAGLDKQGQRQIFYRNLQTGQEKQITDTMLDKISPHIALNTNGQVVMVWEERDKENTFWDVYSHNLSTGVTKKLNQTTGIYVSLQTDGDYAIFKNSRDQYVPYVLVKLSDGTQSLLDKGTSNASAYLNKGKIVFERLDEFSVNLLDLATGTTKLIYKGDDFWPGGMDFNGKYYLMLATNKKDQYKHMILNVETGQTTDLEEWGANRSYGEKTAIGDHYAAYPTKKEGSNEVVINWVDLDAGRVQEMKSPANLYPFFKFNGDQLLMNGNSTNAKLIYRTLKGTEDKFGVFLPKSAPAASPFKAEIVSKTIDAKGGALTSPSGKAMLTFAKGSFTKNAKVSLTSAQVKAGKTTVVSTSWIVAADQTWKKSVTLSLTYDSSLTGGKSLVMAQYNAKSASWKPIGGTLNAKNKMFTAEIPGAGTYGVIVK